METVAFDADATDEHEAALDAAWAAAGGSVDVAVVAFGALGDEWPGAKDPDASVALLRTNALGGGSALLRLAARLERQGSGSIVLLSSVAAERPRPANYVYAAGKAATDFLARGIADATGVRVLVVRPGFVPTQMTAGRKAPPLSATPSQVAEATVDALRRGRGVVYVPPLDAGARARGEAAAGRRRAAPAALAPSRRRRGGRPRTPGARPGSLPASRRRPACAPPRARPGRR